MPPNSVTIPGGGILHGVVSVGGLPAIDFEAYGAQPTEYSGYIGYITTQSRRDYIVMGSGIHINTPSQYSGIRQTSGGYLSAALAGGVWRYSNQGATIDTGLPASQRGIVKTGYFWQDNIFNYEQGIGWYNTLRVGIAVSVQNVGWWVTLGQWSQVVTNLPISI